MSMPATYREDFEGFGEFLGAVARAGDRAGANCDPRLRYAAITGLGEVIPSDGGFAVPSDFALALLDGVEQHATMYPATTRQTITKGNKLKCPVWDETSRAHGSRFGGLSLARTGEGETIVATKPRLKSVNVYLDALKGAIYLTSELSEDWPQATAVLTRTFAMEAATAVDDEIIDGSGTGGEMLGILRSPALIQVTPESGQAAQTIRAENVLKMWCRSWAPGLRRARWYYNQEVGPQIFALADSGIVTFTADGPLMLGQPLIAHESCKTAGSVGDLLLVVPDQFVIGEKPQEVAESIHIKWLEHEQAFRFIWRVSGHPAWNSPLTPLNGSQTTSPFVALGERI